MLVLTTSILALGISSTGTAQAQPRHPSPILLKACKNLVKSWLCLYRRRGEKPTPPDESGLVCIPCSRSGVDRPLTFGLELLAEGGAAFGKCPASSDTEILVRAVLVTVFLRSRLRVETKRVTDTTRAVFASPSPFHLHLHSPHIISSPCNKRAFNGGHGLKDSDLRQFLHISL